MVQKNLTKNLINHLKITALHQGPIRAGNWVHKQIVKKGLATCKTAINLTHQINPPVSLKCKWPDDVLDTHPKSLALHHQKRRVQLKFIVLSHVSGGGEAHYALLKQAVYCWSELDTCQAGDTSK